MRCTLTDGSGGDVVGSHFHLCALGQPTLRLIAVDGILVVDVSIDVVLRLTQDRRFGVAIHNIEGRDEVAALIDRALAADAARHAVAESEGGEV